MNHYFLFLLLFLLSTPSASAATLHIRDAPSKQPLFAVRVIAPDAIYYSDINGTVNLPCTDDNASLAFLKSGYRRISKTVAMLCDANHTETDVLLHPHHIKGLYLSFWGANHHSKTYKRIRRIEKLTPINAIVVDVKNEYGFTSFKVSYKQALENFSHKNRTIVNIKHYIDELHKDGIYVIARIVVFKDELQATSNPEWALKNERGDFWRNHDKLAWVDPFIEQTHQYVIEIAKEAAKMGFDEINFDYIRFPATSEICTSKRNTQANRIAAIEGFLRQAQNALYPLGVFISVDTFGQICWNQDDVRIGQTIHSLAKYSDYLCPMLYPSGFKRGVLGFKAPSSHPYEIIHQSIEQMKKEIEPSRIRPWLQAFRDYAHTKKAYQYSEIQAQIRACEDSNTSGWLFWNPSSRYNIAHFATDKKPVSSSRAPLLLHQHCR